MEKREKDKLEKILIAYLKKIKDIFRKLSREEIEHYAMALRRTIEVKGRLTKRYK